MELFGYKISKKEDTPVLKSVVPPSEDGAIDTYKVSGYYGTYLDIDGGAKNENDLIRKYRECAMLSDVDRAISDICDVAIANLEDDEPVTLDLEKLNLSDKVKKAMIEEFDKVCNLLDFRNDGQGIFRRWYVDGRMFYHKLVDTANKKDGIQEVRYIDPRQIKKVRNIERKKDPKTGVELIGKIDEYYVFNEKGVQSQTPSTVQKTQGVRINVDAITYVPSGLVDADNNMVLSYLHPALRPANQLKLMENSLVIYRLARAPERRIFYVDTGKLPTAKAEQYVKNLMNNYRNKLVYDQNSGEVKDDKKFMSMLEDFWLPRQEGGRGTEITTLPGGQNLGDIEDVNYFQRKLYEALNVPTSRLMSENGGGLNFGKASEITRDELKYAKFIRKLQRQFSLVFADMLRTNCILKNIITDEEWQQIKHKIRFKFAQDTFYEESKQQEILKMRAETLSIMAGFTEIYYPKSYIQKEVLRLTDEQIKEFEKQMQPAVVAHDDTLDKPKNKEPKK